MQPLVASKYSSHADRRDKNKFDNEKDLSRNKLPKSNIIPKKDTLSTLKYNVVPDCKLYNNKITKLHNAAHDKYNANKNINKAQTNLQHLHYLAEAEIYLEK